LTAARGHRQRFYYRLSLAMLERLACYAA